jgi:hypothetical protein
MSRHPHQKQRSAAASLANQAFGETFAQTLRDTLRKEGSTIIPASFFPRNAPLIGLPCPGIPSLEGSLQHLHQAAAGLKPIESA